MDRSPTGCALGRTRTEPRFEHGIRDGQGAEGGPDDQGDQGDAAKAEAANEAPKQDAKHDEMGR